LYGHVFASPVTQWFVLSFESLVLLPGCWLSFSCDLRVPPGLSLTHPFPPLPPIFPRFSVSVFLFFSPFPFSESSRHRRRSRSILALLELQTSLPFPLSRCSNFHLFLLISPCDKIRRPFRCAYHFFAHHHRPRFNPLSFLDPAAF